MRKKIPFILSISYIADKCKYILTAGKKNTAEGGGGGKFE